MAFAQGVREFLLGPRGSLLIGVVSFVLLTALFTVARFPYHLLEPWLQDSLERSTGAHASFQQIEAELDGCTPKVRARGGLLQWADGTRLQITYARVKPAAALSWLWGQPRFALKANSAWGNFRGFVRPGRGAVTGRIEEMALGRIPLAQWGLHARLEGPGELHLDGERGPTHWTGTFALRAGPGEIALGEAGVVIPFDSLAGRFRLTDTGTEFEEPLEVAGPMGRALVAGRVEGQGPVAQRPLALDVDVELRDPALSPMLAGLGIQIPVGTRRLQIGGQLAHPIVRPARNPSRVIR